MRDFTDPWYVSGVENFISVKTQFETVTKRLTFAARQQIPFATAQALNAIARDVRDANKRAMPKIFDRPTPFTMNSIRIIPATKVKPWASVFIMDRAAEYLEPYERGGLHKLPGKGKTWLNPKDYSLLNQYGNFAKGKLRSLQGIRTSNLGAASSNSLVRLLGRILGGLGVKVQTRTKKGQQVFIGTIKTKKGPVGGVWRRTDKGGKSGRGLKLLIRFGDPIPVRQRLNFAERSKQVATRMSYMRFIQAINKAVATARP